MRRRPALLMIPTAVALGALLAGAGVPLAAGAPAPHRAEAAARVVEAPKPVADYLFEGNLRSSIKGAPALRSVGAGNKFLTMIVTGEGRTKVLSFPEGNGLALRTTGLVAADSYSVVLQIRLASAGVEEYARILNPTRAADDNDNGLYLLGDHLSWYDGGSTAGPGVVPARKYVEVAFTRSSTGSLRVYLNGRLDITSTDVDDQAVIQDGKLRFFVDNANGEDTAGLVSRIRVYRGVLSAAKVKKVYDAGH